MPATKRFQTLTRTTVKLARQPTRKPNPNTFNRNALMARENRRRKKEYVESLEKEVNNFKLVNRKLRKLLKKQSKVVRKLEYEKQYYRSVIANKTDILDLVTAVKNTRFPLSMNTFNSVPFSEASSCSPRDSIRTASTMDLVTDPTDNDYKSNLFTNGDNTDSWDNLLGVNDSFPTNLYDDTAENNVLHDKISDEHNYFNTNNEENELDMNETGVCLHVSGGKISLEFCPSCHRKSRDDSLHGQDTIVN